MNDSKPYYELELAAFFIDSDPAAHYLVTATHPAAAVLANGRLVLIPVTEMAPDSVARNAIREGLFAEVFIPHHDADGVAYGFICHVFNRLNHEPAILEALTLQRAAPDILARYRERCELVETAGA